MANIVFPVDCSSGHAVVNIATAGDWATHLVSEHGAGAATTAAQAIAAVLAAQQAQVAAPAAPGPGAPPLTGLAEWGVVAANLQQTESRSGGDIKPAELHEFLANYGQAQSPPVSISMGVFISSFALLIFTHLGSNKLANCGLLDLEDVVTGDVSYVPWVDFFNAGETFFKAHHKTFSPRNLMRSMESALADLYFNHPTAVLKSLKAKGTPASRRVALADGSAPMPHVLVPEIFYSRLTAEEKKARKEYGQFANFDDVERKITVERADPDGEVAQKTYELEMNEAHLERAKQAARRGLRNRFAPTPSSSSLSS
jgi:hypothetical protein